MAVPACVSEPEAEPALQSGQKGEWAPRSVSTEVRTLLSGLSQVKGSDNLNENADFFEVVSKRFCPVGHSSSPILGEMQQRLSVLGWDLLWAIWLLCWVVPGAGGM